MSRFEYSFRTVFLFLVWLIQALLCNQILAKETEDLATGSQLTIVEEPQSVALAPGESAKLRCEVFGTPVPTIEWLHNGKLIRIDSKSYLFNALTPEIVSPVSVERELNYGKRTFQMATTSAKIVIPCADSSRAGLYTCLASNGRETVTANATVRVKDKGNVLWRGGGCPPKKRSAPFAGSPADIYMWTESRMERPGVSVQLMCRAAGSPIPKIRWFEVDENGQSRIPIKSDEHFQLLVNGDLLVKETRDAPMSMYQCEASNEYGTDTITTMILQIIDDTNDADVKDETTSSSFSASKMSD